MYCSRACAGGRAVGTGLGTRAGTPVFFLPYREKQFERAPLKTAGGFLPPKRENRFEWRSIAARAAQNPASFLRKTPFFLRKTPVCALKAPTIFFALTREN